MNARLKDVLLSLIGIGTFLISQISLAQVPRMAEDVLGGTVTAVAADHVTIKTPADEPFTITFEANTTFSKQVGTSFRMVPVKPTEIHVGNTINVFGHLDPDGITKHAKIVMILTPETAQKLLANAGGMGKTDVYGKITAIDGTKLTVARSDNITQVVEVDDKTVYFKGPGINVSQQMLQSESDTISQPNVESWTLAGVKVGDTVFAKGALKYPPTVAYKDNIFLAKRFAVMAVPNHTSPDTAGAAKQ